MIREVLSILCLIWAAAVALVCVIGHIQLIRYFSKPPSPAISDKQGTNAPRVTIIRPVKGLDPCLEECLLSTFHLTYPSSQLSIRFCISSRDDPATATLEALVAKHAHSFDVQLLVEAEDPKLVQDAANLGPNPKIRSMSRAYRESTSDIIWIIDCNVWVNRGSCGRMVDLLYGFGGKRPNKFVHQLPLVVDLNSLTSSLSPPPPPPPPSPTSRPGRRRTSASTSISRMASIAGGLFEETWFSCAHAKFYTAINTVLVAPCIVGKSNMFRRAHLNALTDGQGIDFFSHNICEDHLIGDLLWYRPVPPHVLAASASPPSSTTTMTQKTSLSSPPVANSPRWGNHALQFGDLAVQPVARMGVREYVARRVRWLRVRKFTVVLATLVEPGTESLVCALYGALALTTPPVSTAFTTGRLGIPATWPAFWALWALAVGVWALVDWALYRLLQSGASIEMAADVPPFARFGTRRRGGEWLLAWVGRELLAFPIWAWAIFGGVTVAWRGKEFRVGTDMRVKEVVRKTGGKKED